MPQTEEVTLDGLYQVLLEKHQPLYEQEFDEKKLRYIIYARKSSETAERQARSLGDQISECTELAEREGLKVRKKYREQESAKEPGIRPIFREMLNEIDKGKYDAIIAWHPDRLARNMKEAGEIIDLLDKGIIKTIKFVSYSYQNNTMGKVMLGMAFVMSKQYSDQLSDNVNRGNKKSLEEGKCINIVEHGYIKDQQGRSQPDENSFHLIKRGFKMRLEGASHEKIAKYLNEHNYHWKKGLDTPIEAYTWNSDKVGRFLEKPFYCGIRVYGDKVIKLRDAYDFVPMITVEEFYKINGNKVLSNTKNRRGEKNKKIADFLNNIVICSTCQSIMHCGVTTKKKDGKITKGYYFFRCPDKKCKRVKKSVRAKVILDFVLQFLNKNIITDETIYNKYKEQAEVKLQELKKSYSTQKKRITLEITKAKKAIGSFRKELSSTNDYEERSYIRNDIKDKEKEISKANKELKKIEDAISRINDQILSFPDFLELFKNLPSLIEKTPKSSAKSKLIRIVFSNFYLEEKKIVKYTINSPFRELIDENNSLGRGAGT